MQDNRLGKKAELKIKEWLDRPEEGYCFDRIPDQMSGLWGSTNICDFILFKCPNFYYIESKATYEERFDFSRITDYQFKNMLKKSKINNVFGLVVVLFATHKRAFILHIDDIEIAIKNNHKSININKIDKWEIPFKEIKTLDSKKSLLDYTGEIEDYI